jgi:hypothetical protein
METEFGSVIFDKPAEHESGWACQWKGDDTRPVRIAGTGELSSGVVWVNNLSYDIAAVSGLTGSRFRRSGYFVHELERLWTEVGLASDFPCVNPANVWAGSHSNLTILRTAYTAWLFRQTVLAANTMIPMNAPPMMDMVAGLHERIIPAAKHYFPRGKPSKEVIDALFQTDQSWQPVARNSNSGGEPQKRRIRLYVNRVAQAICMLNMPWPTGRWFDVPDAEINTSFLADPLAWLDRNPMSIFRVTVLRTPDRNKERLINFGANISKKSRQGYWVTAHDLRLILPHCEIEVKKAMICNESMCGLNWLELAQVALNPDEIIMRAGSYSFNLFMDMLWRVMMRPPYDFKEKSNPAAAFLRSYDRLLLFPKVEMLDDFGIDVMGYGSGGVLIDVPQETSMADLSRIAVRCGFFPPFVPKGEIPVEEAVAIAMGHKSHNLPEAGRRLEAAFLLGDLQTIIDMDEVLFDWTP